MSEDWKVQASFKTPAGTLINVRAETPAEVKELLVGVDLIALEIVSTEQKLSGVHNLAPLSTGSSTVTQPDQGFSGQGFPTTPPTVTPSAQQGPTCLHGARVHKSGNTNGKPWSGWMCPTPKGTPNQCPPVWG